MHELSVAYGIVEGAAEEAEKRNARVRAMHLRWGPLSGVVREALQFSYALACQGTSLEDSELVIEEVPVVLRCIRCGADSRAVSLQDLRCPLCEGEAEVVQGRDLQIYALELAHE